MKMPGAQAPGKLEGGERESRREKKKRKKKEAEGLETLGNVPAGASAPGSPSGGAVWMGCLPRASGGGAEAGAVSAREGECERRAARIVSAA